jgi:hypothetical protein
MIMDAVKCIADFSQARNIFTEILYQKDAFIPEIKT